MARKQSLKYIERPDVHWEALLLKFLATTYTRKRNASSAPIQINQHGKASTEFWVELFKAELLPVSWGANPVVGYGTAYYFALNQNNRDPAVRNILWELQLTGGDFAISLSKHMRQYFDQLSKLDVAKYYLRRGLAKDLHKLPTTMFEQSEWDNVAAIFRSPESFAWARDTIWMTDPKATPPVRREFRRRIEEKLSEAKKRLEGIAMIEEESIADATAEISKLQFILTSLKVDQLNGNISDPPTANEICKAFDDGAMTSQDIDEAKKAMVGEDKILIAARDAMRAIVADLIEKRGPYSRQLSNNVDLGCKEAILTIVPKPALSEVQIYSEVLCQGFLSLEQLHWWRKLVVGE